MIDSRLFAALAKKLDEEMDKTRQETVSIVLTPSDYARNVGRYRGLHDAMTFLQEIRKQEDGAA